MKQVFKRSISLLLAFVMVVGVFATIPLTNSSAAGVDYAHNASESTDEYYNLISKTDWDNAPGIVESEIVLNSDAGDDRQVIYIMKADVNNSYVSVIPTYAEMDTSKYQTATMLDQANWIDENMEGEVIGTMNCCLSWYTGYAAERVGEPLGFMMLDGEIMFDPANCGYEYGNVGFPTCVVINKDANDAGEARPDDIPKLEMVQIRTSAELDGWEETVIPVSSGYIVKDGVNQYSVDHGNEAPRSVVGITADGQVVMMLNDGRQSPFSTGMSMYELAEVMIAAGCVWAANCDGGGSSTFVSQRPGEELQVNNSPSDGGLRNSTSGICFISTAPADGTFTRASVEAESQYYTPYSTVQFTAKGADMAGGPAEIPAEALWQLCESSSTLGSIDQNGLFTSNGTAGAVTAQLAYEGEVYGECTVNIVIPDSLVFSQSTLTVPNGESSSFSVTAMYGLIEVVSKSSDYSLALSSADMGTLDGCVLTATADETVTGGSVIATLAYDSSVTATMQVVFGKASEVFYDFENGISDDWYVEPQQQRKQWSKTVAVSHYNVQVSSYAVTSENGMVHEGEGAAAIVSDTSYATLNWAGAAMYWANEDVTYENVSSIGAWVYIPKDAVSYGVRFCLTGVKDGEEASIDLYPITHGDSLYLEESGWHYVSVDVSGYDAIILKQAPAFADVNNNNRYAGFRITFCAQLNGGSSGEYNWVTAAGTRGEDTFYIDDIIIDYSEACDDREEPVFGEVAYIEPISTEEQYLNNQRQTTTVTNYNSVGFSVAVADDTAKINASGLNAASAKAYIDGNEVACTFNGKNISVEAQNLTNGVHTVKFIICDNAGNSASVIRKIDVQAEDNDANIKIVAPEVENNTLFTGSQYWIDVVAGEAEKVEKVTVTLDLNKNNTWIYDQIKTLYGFTATYTTDVAKENILYLTIERTGAVAATGEQTLVSVPVQTWTWKEEDYPGYYPPAGGDNDLNGNSMYDPYEIWNEYVTWNCDLIVNPLEGNAIFTDGTEEWFSGEKIQVDTEQKIGTWWSCSAANKVYFEGKSSWHLHSAGEAQNKDATCTEAGYTGRVFCTGCTCVTEDELGYTCDSHEGCGSVLDWGTTIPALGHTYEFNADGKLACVNGGELFSGVHTDGKTYVDGSVVADGWNEDNTAYYVDGMKLTGSHIIDKAVCTFDDNGNYLSENIYNGFITDDGVTMYFYTNTNYEESYLYVDDAAYYFIDGIAKEGNYTINGETCLFDGGKYVSCSTADVMDAGWQGEAVTYIIYSDRSMILGGEGATYKYTSRAQLPWYNLRTQIRSIFIGKDITSLGHYALADIYYTDSIVFEEDSKLTYIGAGTFLSSYRITEIVIPDSVQTIVQNAFKMCKNLADVYLPRNIKYLHKLAFVNNQNVVMPTIKLHVYEGTYAETYATQYSIPYEYRVFVDTVIASGTCGENATWELYESGKMVIGGSGAMDNYANQLSMPWYDYIRMITSIEIGKDITRIGNYAFAYATNVKTVTFEEGSCLEVVGAASFLYQIYITEVTLPDTVKTIGNLSFAYCARLASVQIPQNTSLIYPRSFYKSDAVVLNVAEGTYAEKYATNNAIAMTVRPFVDEVIADGTCGTNATWTLYASGKMVIGGSGAMDNYANQLSMPWYDYIRMITSIEIGKDITRIGNYAFAYATNVKTVTFEEGSCLEVVGAASFLYQIYITEVTLPDTVKTIGNLSFAYCARLASVRIPQNTSLIYPRSFYKSDAVVLNVAEGTYAEKYATNNAIAMTVRPFVDGVIADGTCGTNATWTLYASGKMVIGGSGAMDNYANQLSMPWYDYIRMITSIEIGKDITRIGNYAFAYATNVKTVTFEEGSCLEVVGAASFMYQIYITEVTLPDTVKTIGNLSFAYCARLASVRIPQNTSLIYPRSFYKSDAVVLNVIAGSYAESFAINNCIAYVAN